MDDIIAQLQKIFRRVLHQPQLALSRETAAKDVEGWDSLAHINIMIAIEKDFKVRFKTSDIVGLKKIAELADLISSKQEQDSQKSAPAFKQVRDAQKPLPVFAVDAQTAAEIRFNRNTADEEELTVVKIYAAAGTHVVANELVFDVENSKVTQEISVPVEGILVHALTVGDKLPFGKTVARIMPPETSDAAVTTAANEMRSASALVARPAFSALVNKENTEHDARSSASSSCVPVRPRKRDEIRHLSRGAGNTMLSVVGTSLGRMEIARNPGDFFAGKITDLVAFEVARLMRKYPMLNAAYCDGTVELHDAVIAGIAFDEGKRLVVFGVENADKKDLPALRVEIEDALVRYVERKLTAPEMTRATFTITDLSAFNLDYIVPILPHGQSCIIGITCNASQEFALHAGFDHRVTEGLEVAKFLGELRDRLLSFAQEHAAVPRCSFCDKSADTEVGSFRGRGLLKLLDARGLELLACHSCWSGW